MTRRGKRHVAAFGSRGPNVEVFTVADEVDAIATAARINSRTSRRNGEVRAEQKRAADKAKIKMPTFNLPPEK